VAGGTRRSSPPPATALSPPHDLDRGICPDARHASPSLRGIDLEIERNCVTHRALGGAERSLKHLNGLFQPTSARSGSKRETRTCRATAIGGKSEKGCRCFTKAGALFDALNVGENLAFPLREAGVTSARNPRACVRPMRGRGTCGARKNGRKAFRRDAERVGTRADHRGPARNHPLTTSRLTGLDPIADGLRSLLIRRLEKQTARELPCRHPLYENAFHDSCGTAWVAFLHEGLIYFRGRWMPLRAITDRVITRILYRGPWARRMVRCARWGRWRN